MHAMQILLFALQDLVSFLSVWHGDPSIRGPSMQAVQNGQEWFSDNFERFFSLLPPLIFILRSFSYESASLQLVIEPTAGTRAYSSYWSLQAHVRAVHTSLWMGLLATLRSSR